jgi:hypothetical protein
MVYGNITVFFTVIAVVLCVLGLTFVGVYYLNKAVDQSAR